MGCHVAGAGRGLQLLLPSCLATPEGSAPVSTPSHTRAQPTSSGPAMSLAVCQHPFEFSLFTPETSRAC